MTQPTANSKPASRPFKRFYCDQKDVFLLPPTAFKIWVYHYTREGIERQSWPSRETICKELNISLGALKAGRKLLVKTGWLVPVGQRDARSGEFAVPVFMVDEGTVVQKMVYGNRGTQNSPRSRVKNCTAVAGQKLAPEVYSTKQVDSKGEVEKESLSSEAKPEPRRQRRQDFFVWLKQIEPDLSLTGKEKALIRTVLDGRYDLSVIQTAARSILSLVDVKNSFDHAGDKLANNLDETCQAVIKDQQERIEFDARKERIIREMQAEVKVNLEAAEAANAAEAALAEVGLGL
jgi:hypothetical protein